MKNVAVIGAGPIGLYLAVQLKKAGVKNSTLYDPRAGSYIRPGHINGNDLAKMKYYLGISGSSPPFGHIKEFERIIFNEVQKLNIPVQNKKFIRFEQVSGNKGIIVQNSEGQEEFVACDVVFDCTGSQRCVLNAVNQRVTPPPFTISPIANNIKVKQHLLAYVKISPADVARINDTGAIKRTTDFFSTSEQQVNSINTLRQFGWKEFGMPYIYGTYFGKNKACLYAECPDNLPPESYEVWLKTLIELQTKTSDIAFSQLPPSKKYSYKPRLVSFALDPQETEQVAFHNDDIPLVIPMGDSQIEPNYTLAHGIRDSLDRVHAFIQEIEILDGAIVYFDKDVYRASISNMLKEHRNAITAQYAVFAQYFDDSLELAEKNYLSAINQTQNEQEAETLNLLLKEIKARIAYNKALLLLWRLSDGSFKLSLANVKPDTVFPELQHLSKLLIQAYSELPSIFAAERANTLTWLNETALALKECGNQFIRIKKDNDALISYQEVLTIYRELGISVDLAHMIIIQSNIVICYGKLNQHYKAVQEGLMALEHILDTQEYDKPRQKLLYNVLKNQQKIILNMDFNNETKADALLDTALHLLAKHPNVLEPSTHSELSEFFNASKKGKFESSPITPDQNDIFLPVNSTPI